MSLAATCRVSIHPFWHYLSCTESRDVSVPSARNSRKRRFRDMSGQIPSFYVCLSLLLRFVYGEFSGLCQGWFYHTQWPSLLSIFCCRISTPLRFGKTIAVCLFVAALIFACPNVEISIYSTCERHPNMHIVCYVRPTLHTPVFGIWRAMF